MTHLKRLIIMLVCFQMIPKCFSSDFYLDHVIEHHRPNNPLPLSPYCCLYIVHPFGKHSKTKTASLSTSPLSCLIIIPGKRATRKINREESFFPPPRSCAFPNSSWAVSFAFFRKKIQKTFGYHAGGCLINTNQLLTKYKTLWKN